ncbi:hypothetical protein THAOC_31654, partial [Thalassiosira oceanica]
MEVEAILNSRDAGDSDDACSDDLPLSRGTSSSDAIRRLVGGISLRDGSDDSDEGGGGSDDIGFNLNFASSSLSRPVPAGAGEDMDGQFPLRDGGPSARSVERDADGPSGPARDGGRREDGGPPAGLRAAESNELRLLSSGAGR